MSPVLVVKPSIPRSPLHAKPSLSSPRQPQPAFANDATPATTVVHPLKLSYAEVLKSSGNLSASGNTLKSSSGKNNWKSPDTTSSPITSPSLPNGKQQRKSRMEKKLDFEVEKAKLKARRMAKKGFERQTGKAWDNDLTKQEWEIYQAQVKRHEEALLQQKAEEEAAAILAANIKHKEIVLQQLQTDLASKQQQIEEGKEELERFRLDFEESLKEQFPSSSAAEKSAAVRMREEQAKKKLRAAWRNGGSADDPVQETRRNILIAQEDVAALTIRINHLRKELNKMKEIAAREASSKQIMRDERRKREEMKKMGIEKPKAEPKPKPPPPAPILRSHQMRMAEQQAAKAKARAARLSTSSSSSSSSSSSASSSSSSSSSAPKSR